MLDIPTGIWDMLGAYAVVGSPVGVMLSISTGDAIREGIIDNRSVGLTVGTVFTGETVGTKGVELGIVVALGVGFVGVGAEGPAGDDVGIIGAGRTVGLGSKFFEGAAVSKIRVGTNVLLLEGGGANGGGIGTSIVSSYKLGTRSNKSVPMYSTFLTTDVFKVPMFAFTLANTRCVTIRSFDPIAWTVINPCTTKQSNLGIVKSGSHVTGDCQRKNRA